MEIRFFIYKTSGDSSTCVKGLSKVVNNFAE